MSLEAFFLASLPVTDLIEMMRPEAPSEVRAAARALRYREHIGINLLVGRMPVSRQLDLRAQFRGGYGPDRKLQKFLARDGWKRRRQSDDG